MNDFPYPGLRPFKREETNIFFGRDKHTNQLIDKLGHTHFVAVVGASGCGKSSLVRTGLVACLQRGLLVSAGVHWCIVECRPSNRPFTFLAKALLQNPTFKEQYTANFFDDTEAQNFLEANLRRGSLSLHNILQDSPLPSNNNLLLIVDQFEELFRYHQQGEVDETEAFINLLLQSSKPFPFGDEKNGIYVVITMRSDFMGECAKFHGLPEAVNEGLFLTPRLTREQLQEAIEGPAKVFGGQIYSALSNRLLNEMDGNPDQLPVLQHALMRMWHLAQMEKTTPIVLTLKHYDKIGKLEGALSQHADEIYEQLSQLKEPKNPQQIIEILFRRLCERDKARRDTRSPVRLEEVARLANLSSWQQVVPAVDIFRQPDCCFLTPPTHIGLNEKSIIDISHESFIRLWKRLQKWLEAETHSADIYRRLENNAILWQQDKIGLLRTPELENALAWYNRVKPNVQWANRYGQNFDLAMRFLSESETEKKREQKEKEATRQKELEQAQKLAATRQQALEQAHKISIFQKQKLFGAMTALAISVVLFIWALSARQEALLAQHKEEIAKQQAINETEKRTIGLFESQLTHAILLARDEDYQKASHILTETHQLDTEIKPTRLPVRNLLERLTEINSGSYQQIYHDTGTPLFAVAISPDGQQLVAGGEKGILLLFDTKTGQLLTRLQGDKGKGQRTYIKAVVFHPQGKWVASIGYEGNIILWALPDGKLLTQWAVGIEPALALAISPNGRYLASEGKNHHITLWDVETQQSQQQFEGHQDRISGLAFSPNGEWLASASYDGTVGIWEIKTGQKWHQLEFGPENRIQKVAFSQDSQLLATSNLDKMVRLWKVESGKVLKVLLGHQETVYSVRFIANDRYLVSTSRDKTLRIWETQSGVTVRVLQGHTASVSGLATFNQIFSASNDGTIRRWDMTLPYQQIVDLSNEPAAVAIAPTGDKIAVGFKNGSLHLYALPNATHLLWEQLKAHIDRVKSLAFSADGKWLASASYDNTVKIWTVKKNQLIERHQFIYKDIINAVTFTPDTKKLAIAGNDGQVHLFTLNNQQTQTYQAYEQEPVNSLSFFEDQEKNALRLLTTGDFQIKLWNINQWQNDKPALLQTYPKTTNYLAWSMLSPDGQKIASVGRASLVHLYSTINQSTQYHLGGHKSTIYRVIFSKEGSFIVTASADATLRFWDLEKHHELFTLRLPAKSLRPVPLWDFDFQSTPTGSWIAVPLTRNQLILYELGNLYDSI